MKRKITKEEREFFRAVMSLSCEEECAAFFDDVCTIKEMQALTQRLSVAYMLNSGEKYQDIEKKTGASTATISRVNKCLNYGSGGYRAVIEKTQKSGEGEA